MKNQLIKSVLLLLLILVASTSMAQQIKKVYFSGYQFCQFQQMIQVGYNKYQPMFTNYETYTKSGKIEINEKTKHFKIVWTDGDVWNCKYRTKTITTDRDEAYGNVLITNYSGKWTDEDVECELHILKTVNQGCITNIRSVRINDPDFHTDTWQKFFVFGTKGECFSNN